MSETPKIDPADQIAPQPEGPQFPDTSKAEPFISNKGLVAGAVAATLAVGAAAYETGVFDTSPPSKPKVGRLMSSPNASGVRHVGDGTYVKFKLKTASGSQPLVISETQDGGLIPYAPDGSVYPLTISVPTDSNEGPGQMFKDVAKVSEVSGPYVDYVADETSENVSRKVKGDTIVTTTVPAPEGEAIQIRSDGHGGLVATHGGQPVVTTLNLPAPPPEAK